jgi:hypothetical protein
MATQAIECLRLIVVTHAATIVDPDKIKPLRSLGADEIDQMIDTALHDYTVDKVCHYIWQLHLTGGLKKMA